jgi:hypothetical protein
VADGPFPPAVNFDNQPADVAGFHATRLLDSILLNGGSPQLQAARDAFRSQTIVYAVTHPDEVQAFLDANGLDYPADSPLGVMAFADAACGAHDAELMEQLRGVPEGERGAEQTEVLVDGIDILDIDLGPNPRLPGIEEIVLSDPTALMDALLEGQPGSAALEEERERLRVEDPTGQALADFDARVLTALSTTHIAAAEDQSYARALGLNPVEDADKLSLVPRGGGFGSTATLIAYFMGMQADNKSDEIKKKLDEIHQAGAEKSESSQFELKALMGQLEQLTAMGKSLLDGVIETMKDAARVR